MAILQPGASGISSCYQNRQTHATLIDIHWKIAEELNQSLPEACVSSFCGSRFPTEIRTGVPQIFIGFIREEFSLIVNSE
jgi:hypothetical protein